MRSIKIKNSKKSGSLQISGSDGGDLKTLVLRNGRRGDKVLAWRVKYSPLRKRGVRGDLIF